MVPIWGLLYLTLWHWPDTGYLSDGFYYPIKNSCIRSVWPTWTTFHTDQSKRSSERQKVNTNTWGPPWWDQGTRQGRQNLRYWRKYLRYGHQNLCFGRPWCKQKPLIRVFEVKLWKKTALQTRSCNISMESYWSVLCSSGMYLLISNNMWTQKIKIWNHPPSWIFILAPRPYPCYPQYKPWFNWPHFLGILTFALSQSEIWEVSGGTQLPRANHPSFTCIGGGRRLQSLIRPTTSLLSHLHITETN